MKHFNEIKDKSLVVYINDCLEQAGGIGKFEKLAAVRFANDLKDKRFYFNEEKAELVVYFIEHFCKHFDGRYSGKEFILSHWQKFIVYNLFGFYWVGKDARRFNKAYVEVARKNGKTTFSAAILIFMLMFDGEEGSQCFVGATKKEQAQICLDNAAKIIGKNEELKELTKIYTYRGKANNIISFKNGGNAQCLVGREDSQDGYSPHFACVDEFHQHKTSDIVELLEQGMGARHQPLIFIITTAGKNRTSPCYLYRKTMTDVLESRVQLDNVFTVIYAPDETAEWYSGNNFRAANPNLGISVSEDFLKAQLDSAKIEGGPKEFIFKTKNLNLWVDSSVAYIDSALWKKCGIKQLSLGGCKSVYVGIDLSSTTDITAICAVGINSRSKVLVQHWYFMPEDKIVKSKDVSFYRKWRDEGHLIATEGNVVDYEYIRNKIHEICDKYEVDGIMYDRWNSSQLVVQLTDDGLPMEPFGQGYASMNYPTKEISRLIDSETIRHDSNPVTAWMLSNVELAVSPSGDVKPDKAKSTNKIDGVVAMCMAISPLSDAYRDSEDVGLVFF